MTALPPSDAGAFQDNVTWPFDAVATRLCGTVGTLAGVAATTVLVAPEPTALIALIRKLYWFPLVKPLTVVEATVELVFAIAVVQFVPPSVDVSTK